MKRAIGIVELCFYGFAISLGGLLAAAALFTKLQRQSEILFSFNNYGEHLVESIIFPLVVIVAFVFLLIRAYNLK